MVFVDTNYFLRFLIDDDPQQAEEAKKIFLDAARGNLELVTSTIVVFEIYWVFKSYYQKTKDEIIKILQKVLTMNFVRIDERDLLQFALNLYKVENLSLEDCYSLILSATMIERGIVEALHRAQATKDQKAIAQAEALASVLKAVKLDGFQDVPLPQAETLVTVQRFSQEAREILEKQKYVIYELTAQSIKSLRET